MAVYKPVANFLWPNRTQPAINEAIACFLAPAGMVYAVSFGFAFQQVLQKQLDITARLNNDFSEMELLMKLTKKLTCLKSATRMKMYLALKEEIMTVIQYITEMHDAQNNREGIYKLHPVLYFHRVGYTKFQQNPFSEPKIVQSYINNHAIIIF